MAERIKRVRPRLVTNEPDAPFEIFPDGESRARGHDLMCPNCNRPFARRSNRSGILDFLASLLLVYPYRCQLCAHRFMAWPKLSSPSRHREFERLHVQFPVAYRSAYLDRPVSGEGTITDLSIHGCSISTQQATQRGTFLQLYIRYSEKDAPVTVDVAVVRASNHRQIGVEFLTLHPAEESKLRRLLEHLLYGRFH